MLSLTKRFKFAASHRLYRSEWSEDRNRQEFGRCADLHGHNYVLEVEIVGKRNLESNMILNADILKEVVNAQVVDDLDHKDLNSEVKWFSGAVPTVEGLVEAVWERLLPALRTAGVELYRVTIFETDTVWATKRLIAH